MGYGNSGAPAEGVVTPAERNEAAPGLPGRQEAAEQLKTTEVAVEAPEGMVAFVAAAEHANSDYLVEAGKLVKAPFTAGTTPGMIPIVKRDGDVWAKFTSGVLTTDDPKVIKWCDEHPTICRRSDDPTTKSWATLKELQARKSNREQLLDTSEMDADEAFPPNLVNNLREQAAKPGSSGDQLVERAEQERAAASPSVT
jgi:hypothetical protein